MSQTDALLMARVARFLIALVFKHSRHADQVLYSPNASCSLLSWLRTRQREQAGPTMDNQLDTLLHLNRRLRTLVLRAIIAGWKAGERDIASQDIYTELVE